MLQAQGVLSLEPLGMAVAEGSTSPPADDVCASCALYVYVYICMCH